MATTILVHGLTLLVITASMFAVSVANKDWPFGFNFNHLNKTQEEPRKIIVGGSEHWHFGYNYTDWAIKNRPFFLDDILVFKYDAPNATTFPHSVYLFPNQWSFMNCDFKGAEMVANHTQGAGEGFQFVLRELKSYYFGCGEGNGFHCNIGQMKFTVMPLILWS